MNIVVTGGAGFIGSHVADAYIEKGHKVIIIDDLSSGKKENINLKAEFHHRDINDPEVEDIFKNNQIDILNHHAAQMDVRVSVADPVYDASINIIGGIKLMEYCRKYGVKKVIFSSTGGVIYGEPDYMPADEVHPIRPQCPYGVSKYSFENYMKYYYDLYNLDYTIFRYGNVYGPRQDPHGEAGVVAIFSGLLLKGEKCKIFGSGNSTRDYIYIDDIVRGNLMALEAGGGEIFNLGTGIATSVNTLYDKMKNLMKRNLEPQHEAERPGEIENICLDYKKAEKIMDWKPLTSMEEGLQKTISFFARKMNQVSKV